MKKKLLVIAGILVVVVAAVIVLYLVFINDSTKTKHNPEASYGSDYVGLDKSGDLGTGKVVSKDQVSKVLGDQGTNIQGPELSGVLRLGTQKSQTATYTFKMKNGKEAEVNIDARTYESKKDMDNTGPFKGTEPAKVEGVGDEAHFLIPTQKEYQLLGNNIVLMATKGTTSYAISLSQKADGVAIDAATARDIITKVAQEANLDAVK
jgi:hypothetical protein